MPAYQYVNNNLKIIKMETGSQTLSIFNPRPKQLKILWTIQANEQAVRYN